MTREPNDVAASVHVEGNSLRAKRKGEGVITSRSEREGDLTVGMTVVVEASGGASGGGFEEMVSTVVLGFRERMC